MSDSILLEQKTLDARVGKSVEKQRLYIFPTQHGMIFAVMVVVMLIGSVNYTNSMAYMLTFLLASLYMVCMLHTYRNLRGLKIKTNNADPVYAGDTAEFPVVVINRTGNDRHSIYVDPRSKKRMFGRSLYRGAEYSRVSAGKIIRSVLPVKTQSRGWLRPGRLRIHSTYPLGLFRAWSYIQCTSSCLVYPRPEGSSRLPPYTQDPTQDQHGDQTGTDDFTGVRQYRPGDSIRNIDWKALAREQDVLIKKFSGSGSRQLVLRWKQTAQLVDVEKRLSQLALWLVKAEQNGLRYGLEIPGCSIAAGFGEQHRHLCLTALAEYGQ